MDAVKAEIIHSILVDNLEQAKTLIGPSPKGLKELAKLVRKTVAHPPPLAQWESPLPPIITTSVSYTCGIGCEMCNAGFSDKTRLFDQYKYLSLKEFDALSSWIKSASHVALVGLGETLDSPHIEYFLNSLKDKVSIVSTSGMPLNITVIEKLIKSQLHYLNLSFDGKTTAGHGGARETYTKKFWKKVGLVQKIKQSLKVSHPFLHLTIAVDHENIEQLDEILLSAQNHDIPSADLIYMVPHNRPLYEKSVFPQWEDSKDKINSVMKTWNQSGMHVRFFEKLKIEATPKTCHFVDKHIMFNLNRQRPDLCCGSLDMPLAIGNLKPEDYWNSFPFRYFRSLHFSESRAELPEICRSCWVLNPKNLKNSFGNQPRNYSEAICLEWYNHASQLKLEQKIGASASFFKKVIRTTPDSELKGKAWFHVGEISLQKNRPEEALNHMEKAVQFCFDHALAFAYLSLLYRLVGKDKVQGQGKSPDYEYMNFFKPIHISDTKSLPSVLAKNT